MSKAIFKSMIIGAAATAVAAVVAGPASAGERERSIIISCAQQGALDPGSMQMCSGLFVPHQVFHSCMQGGPCFGPDRFQPAMPGRQGPGPGMGIDMTPLGPMAGAATAGALNGMGVPPPIAGWAGDRVRANTEAAGRERNLPDAAVRIFSGASPRDIRDHGILGGPNSEPNKILRGLGIR